MITAIIIDDEPKGRLALRQKLMDYCPDVTVAGEAGDGEEGLRLIEDLQPNIVFLDIEMPRISGFDMLLRVRQQNFHLIFSTAYDHYAIKAIRFAAFDYLLKPVDIEELKAVIQRIKNNPQQGSTATKIEALAHNLKHTLNKIAISTIDGLLFFDIGDIIHIEAHSNYTVFSFVNRPKLTVSKTLKEFEDLLPPQLFFRPHHSHLINLHFIKRYIKGDGGTIEMQNGELVDVSRRKKEEFLKLIGL
ncbi:LytTR family DNA-binding domain-containing protein [Flavitalea sp. BT771]|uniref:LytR/AlgR family response regulator transcription factor n=1 Tax=Flavitalea sp. BT771 TaxID=3063329 RepID=UPI0026E1B4FF|nr:LytTR family DNA-binding domain-containing protein [Flavitalea sp. BT771]MDO6430848.1 LytTR family DNA-binding domain-containing protein [Flavitalea sp. BT771]MDV6219012.1 LytTR family DNA-binding domain-containing protein [Flavitalea sp. BT771]